MANRLGQSTENAIKSSALFYQQGLDTAEALTLTEDTMKLATLSGQGFEEATKQMTAALRGFHMEMEQGSHITDVYSELAANAAADVHGIAYAMSKTASIASSAGMSFENTAAFLTNMIETTQEAPENIGTAMKTIIARFTELKENVSAADSEFDDLDYNKVDKALKSVSINLKDTNGQFRNLDDVFLELSSKWSTLDRNTQRYIATTAAGSRQQSRFIAMMEDYGRTMELVETA
jgi:phage tail tape measure protein, TP901 family, core region